MQFDFNIYTIEFLLMMIALCGSVTVVLMAGKTLNRRSRDVIVAWTSLDLLFRHRQKELSLLVTICREAMPEKGVLWDRIQKDAESVEMTRGIGDVETLSQSEEQLRKTLTELEIEAEITPELHNHPRYPHIKERVDEFTLLINGQGASYNTAVMRNHNAMERFPHYLIAGWLGFELFKPFTYKVTNAEAMSAEELLPKEDEVTV